MSSSLLLRHNASDTLVFEIMGKGWNAGFVPYRDFFDHKGPVLYLIQALGYSLLPGKLGVFLLEWLFAVVSFEILYRCGRILGCPVVLNLFAVGVAMIFWAFTIELGNTTEEWSMPFEVLSLYLVLRYLKGVSSRIAVPALIIGLCFGFVAMVRLNNNCIICGEALFFVAWFAYKRQFGSLAKVVAFFILGCLLAVLPFVIYFIVKGSVFDMVLANYTFNIDYLNKWAVETSTMDYIRRIVRMIPCLVLPVAAYFYSGHGSKLIFPLMAAISVVTFAVFFKGAGYIHYYVMIAPLAALCVQVCAFNPRRGFFLGVLISFPYWGYQSYSLSKYLMQNVKEQDGDAILNGAVEFISENIPPAERDSVYAMGMYRAVDALWRSGHYPVGKYFFLQDKFVRVNDFVKDDISRSFKAANPRWIVSTFDLSDGAGPVEISNYYRFRTVSSADEDSDTIYFYIRAE
ncbi:MAG: hypothetical protein K2M06_07250 [Muribaculaceae bacterium]|nr:hypothetical protein [Muribaculaceae bacterium]